jgi:uncharacterized protein YecE (DUF72 family)
MNKQVTHKQRLVDCDDVLDWFLGNASALGGKFGPLLVQLPPSFRKDTKVLGDFLDRLRERPQCSTLPVAVEFRHPSWLDEEVHTVLRDHGAALCLADHPKCTAVEPATADFVYIRRHGPGGRYRANYADEMLRDYASLIRTHLRARRDVYVYFNNDLEGHAVRNAARLEELLTGRDPLAEAP